MENTKYDNTTLSRRNFNVLDNIIFWGFGVSIVGLIISFFLSIWIDFNFIGQKVILTMFLYSIISLFYGRLIWVDPTRKATDEKLWRDKYSQKIKG
ncbi:MAG: hypothetical protein SLAVMIC_00267 [uncultured marine phage]|uniref:Uncharacterized protein n=1 Tax=uncultured marine phage TaxID=707152 RepID=A0A8D9FQX6_9VIRU|nr:MAG: hypothetical protein SLAVMIC_00267 [uncultured marine phage]